MTTKINAELLDALVALQKQIHAHYKMNVKKDFSLMLADSQASKAIANAKDAQVSKALANAKAALAQ